MDIDLYERFVFLKGAGQKVEAKASLASFIASFETSEERRAWVYSFLERRDYGHKIRHEIYEALVYPVLLDGYLKKDANCTTLLAKTANNFSQINPLHPSLEGKSDLELFEEAYALAPDEGRRDELLSTRLRGFEYSEHEWPAGILWGIDGANIEQCQDILQDIEFAKHLDIDRKYAATCPRSRPK